MGCCRSKEGLIEGQEQTNWYALQVPPSLKERIESLKKGVERKGYNVKDPQEAPHITLFWSMDAAKFPTVHQARKDSKIDLDWEKCVLGPPQTMQYPHFKQGEFVVLCPVFWPAFEKLHASCLRVCPDAKWVSPHLTICYLVPENARPDPALGIKP